MGRCASAAFVSRRGLGRGTRTPSRPWSHDGRGRCARECQPGGIEPRDTGGFALAVTGRARPFTPKGEDSASRPGQGPKWVMFNVRHKPGAHQMVQHSFGPASPRYSKRNASHDGGPVGLGAPSMKITPLRRACKIFFRALARTGAAPDYWRGPHGAIGNHSVGSGLGGHGRQPCVRAPAVPHLAARGPDEPVLFRPLSPRYVRLSARIDRQGDLGDPYARHAYRRARVLPRTMRRPEGRRRIRGSMTGLAGFRPALIGRASERGVEMKVEERGAFSFFCASFETPPAVRYVGERARRRESERLRSF